MKLKENLRVVNRTFRSVAAYDRFYRRVHSRVISKYKKGSSPNELAQYYHSRYNHEKVVPGRVLLDSFWGQRVGCNPYAIYLEMRADPRCDWFEYIWVCNDEMTLPEGMADDPAVSIVNYQSLAYQNALLSAHYLIANSNFPPHFTKKPDQVFINTWHGTPIKKIGRDADARFLSSANTQRNYFASDIILSYSEVATQRTVCAHGAQDALERVHEIGTPRIDLTLKGNRDEVRRKMGVTRDKPILLYAPTWRGEFGRKNANLDRQVAEISRICEDYAKTHEVFVSVHNITAEGLADRKVRFRQVPPNLPINFVLAGVDTLITDYSSIAVDFLVLDRPIVLFCPDYEVFEQHQGFYFDLKTFPAAFCEDHASLERALEQPRKPSDFDSYAAFKDEIIPLENGQASSRALDIILADRGRIQPRPDKIRVVLYGGGFLSNGITSSLVTLTNAIDYDRFDVTLVFDSAAVDKDTARQINIAKLSPHCQFVTRRGPMTYSPPEQKAFSRFCETGYYGSDKDHALIDAAFSREASRIFGEQSYDVAIDFSGYGPFWALVMSHVDAKRKLIFQHNDMYREAYNLDTARSFPELPAVFSLYERFNGIVAVTPQMLEVNKRNLAEYYAAETTFHAAQNAIDGDRIKKRADVPVSLVSPQIAAIAQEDLYLFCCVARLSPEKNHVRLLDAFAQVLQSNPNCALIIIGTGKLSAMLEAHAAVLGISDRVVFLGHLDNPFAVMNVCDCKVLASHYEGQGIVLLEALTLGLNCIATDNPAIRNVLEGGMGTIVPQDTDALAEAMLAASRANDPRPTRFDPETYAQAALSQFYDAVGGKKT